jgi:hypothetical protein
MTTSRATWMLLLCALIGLMSAGPMGCGGSKTNEEQERLTEGAKIPEYFKHIPADSPYVFASIKPVPFDLVSKPMLEAYGSTLSSTRTMLSNEIASQDPEYVDKQSRLALAVLEELDGKLTREGLGSLGIAVEGLSSIYGIGIYPVMRMELADGAKFEQMLARVEGKVGEKIPTRTFQGITYRELTIEEVNLPIVIQGSELILGVVHQSFYDRFMGMALGKEKPAKSLYDDNRVLSVLKKYKYKPYMTGYVDTQLLASAMFDDMLKAQPMTLTGQSMRALVKPSENDQAEMANCKAEMMQIAAQHPRFVFGYEELNKTEMRLAMGLESSSPLHKALLASRAPLPGHGSDNNRSAMVGMGMGFNLQALVDNLRPVLEGVQNKPYTCVALTEMNNMAQESYFSMQGLPQDALNLRGMQFSLRDFDFSDGQLKMLKATLVLRTQDPAALVELIKPMSPELQSLALSDNGTPVALNISMLQAMLPGIPAPMIAMTKDGLGISIGEGMESDMVGVLKNSPAGPTPVLAFVYDMRRLVAAIHRAMPEGAMGESEEMFMSMLKAYEKFGSLSSELELREEGTFVRTRVQFAY